MKCLGWDGGGQSSSWSQETAQKSPQIQNVWKKTGWCVIDIEKRILSYYLLCYFFQDIEGPPPHPPSSLLQPCDGGASPAALTQHTAGKQKSSQNCDSIVRMQMWTVCGTKNKCRRQFKGTIEKNSGEKPFINTQGGGAISHGVHRLASLFDTQPVKWWNGTKIIIWCNMK